jgi:hypothetical protein
LQTHRRRDGALGGSADPASGAAGAASADAVFDDMLTGWKQQQQARNFTAGTIRGRASLVRRFVDHTGHFPWDWTAGDADEFFAPERSILNLTFATIRAYQTHLKVFCSFLTDPVYEWDRICSQGFGRSPTQIITEFNRDRPSRTRQLRAPQMRRRLQRQAPPGLRQSLPDPPYWLAARRYDSPSSRAMISAVVRRITL